MRTRARSRLSAQGFAAAVGVITLGTAALIAAAAGPSQIDGTASLTASAAVLVQSNVRYGPEAEELADVYQPSGATAPLPAVLVVHGGGWVAGSKSWTSGIASQIAAAGFVTVNVDYQLATAATPGFPHQLHELKQAVEWIRSQASALNVDPARIAALGSSAGGNLVAMLGTDAWGPLTGGNRIRAAVSWSAPLDLTNQPSLLNDVSTYVGCTSSCSAVLTDASPLYHISSDDTPIAIFNSSDEIVPVQQVIATYQKLRQARVLEQLTIYPGNVHGTAYSSQALPPSIAFLTQQLA